MKFRKKSTILIEATQWFKNGDHPEDNCQMVYPDPHSTTQFAPFLGEGKVVRYFRRPDLIGSEKCKECNDVYYKHGWIDTLEGGHIVCPSDWIVTGIVGEKYPVKDAIFQSIYEAVDE